MLEAEERGGGLPKRLALGLGRRQTGDLRATRQQGLPGSALGDIQISPAQHALQQCAVNRLPAGAGQVEQVVVDLAGGFAERR